MTRLLLIEKTILSLMQGANEPLTTREIEKRIERMDVRCPDTPAHYLNRLRNRGVIDREFSHDKKGFVWYIKVRI